MFCKSFFHKRHKQGTCSSGYTDLRVFCLYQFFINLTFYRRLCTDHSDFFIDRLFPCRPRSRCNNTDDRNLKFFPHRIQSKRTRCIAGNHNRLHFLRQQEADNLTGIADNCSFRLASIRYSCSISEIHNTLIRKLPHNLPCHCKSSDSGIKYADRHIFLILYLHNISPSICHICSLLYPLIRQISRACSLYSKSRSNEKQKKNIFNHPPSLDARPN